MDTDAHKALQAELIQLLSNEKEFLDMRERKLLREFIDAGEYGVALETFADLVIVRNHLISPSLFLRIKTLASRMQIENELPLVELQRHVQANQRS